MRRSIYILLLMLAILIGTASVGNVRGHLDERWSQDLTPEQRQQAKEIMKAAHPRIKELRKDVKVKIRALEEFCFAKAGDDQTLAKLGQELQESRDALRNELMALDKKLMQEVGVSIRGYRGRNSAGLSKETPQESVLLQRHINHTPHHGEQ